MTEAVARVHYYAGQFLRTVDFTEEQRYHLAMRRRHNIGHHTWGIVTGLALTLEDGRPVVEPGMAVDGYGRELVIVQRTPLDVPGAFTARATDRLDVWAAYELVTAGTAPEGYATCIDGNGTAYRVVEQPVIRYTVPDPDETDRRRPATVPPDDHGFGPERTPPDDPIDDWPVFLGSVTRRRADGQDTYIIDVEDRPYVGLVGEEVRAPSGRVSVQVGAEHDDDPFRFAVRLTDVPSAEIPRLSVLREGGVAVVGQTSLLGNVEVGGVVEVEAGPAVEDLSAVAAGPWTLSHVADTSEHHELRLQMDGSGAVPDEMVVGTWKEVTQPDGSKSEKFVPCLTIQSDCTVTVHGDLVVEGTLLATDGRPLQFSEAASSVVKAAFLSGLGGAASSLINAFYEVTPGSGQGNLALALSALPADHAGEVAAHVAADVRRLDALAGELRRAHPEAAERLRTALSEPD